jgi:hypothetical protein
MPLLLAADFKTHIYPEIIDAISRADDTILEAAIDAAEAKAKSYLDKYSIDTLFTATEDSRKNDLLSICKDLACWEFCKLSNANLNLAFFKELNDDAVRWLKDVQAGRSVPYGWPTATNAEGTQSTFFHVGGNPKRSSHY